MKMKRGYTLIELIIVIVILTIIIIMTIPNTSYFNSLRERIELQEFKKDILFNCTLLTDLLILYIVLLNNISKRL